MQTEPGECLAKPKFGFRSSLSRGLHPPAHRDRRGRGRIPTPRMILAPVRNHEPSPPRRPFPLRDGLQDQFAYRDTERGRDTVADHLRNGASRRRVSERHKIGKHLEASCFMRRDHSRLSWMNIPTLPHGSKPSRHRLRRLLPSEPTVHRPVTVNRVVARWPQAIRQVVQILSKQISDPLCISRCRSARCIEQMAVSLDEITDRPSDGASRMFVAAHRQRLQHNSRIDPGSRDASTMCRRRCCGTPSPDRSMMAS